jgi:hypothetical protein
LAFSNPISIRNNNTIPDEEFHLETLGTFRKEYLRPLKLPSFQARMETNGGNGVSLRLSLQMTQRKTALSKSKERNTVLARY